MSAAPLVVSVSNVTARDRLLRAIADNTELPALGSSISRVVQLASSDDEAVHELAYLVLSDVALSQKVLRLSNIVYYRTASGKQVTTISKAIFVLGFDVVKTTALAMMLVEGLSGRHARSVRIELQQALCASIIGRELARRSHYKDAEEAAVAALFKNIGRLLVAAYDPDLYDEIAALVESGQHSPFQASMQVLGCSFDMLSEVVLQEWQIPDTIVHALTAPQAGELKPARSRQEWVQQVAAFSTAASAVVPFMQRPGAEMACRPLLYRYGAALNLDYETLETMFASVGHETDILMESAQMANEAQVENPFGAHEPRSAAMAVLKEVMLVSAEEPTQVHARHASGKPLNARELLLAGIQDATEMMASGRCRTNDLIMLALETLYNGLGFRFAAVCMKDVQRNQFRARVALGEHDIDWQSRFVFSAQSSRDIFHLALENDADLMISDASDPKISALIPSWHRALLPDAASFILLPLIVHKKPIGFFYADREQVAPEGVPPDETALIKTLKGQVLAALQAR
ncbi:MAG TPA: HDOD domain-containing protein [Oxalicibacterium sp.]|jgi:HD-like signal output (HDOD) protein|nr:HDOD domain-containing protein [Oxalicibacterium sp.]